MMEQGGYAANGVKHCVRPVDMSGMWFCGWGVSEKRGEWRGIFEEWGDFEKRGEWRGIFEEWGDFEKRGEWRGIFEEWGDFEKRGE